MQVHQLLPSPCLNVFLVGPASPARGAAAASSCVVPMVTPGANCTADAWQTRPDT